MKKLLHTGGDYRSHKNPSGGSKPGRKNMRWLPLERAMIYVWALHYIADGDEGMFLHDASDTRWSETYYAKCHTFLRLSSVTYMDRMRKADAECSIYNRIMHRHHKMYYINDPKTKVRMRGKSSEHPDNNVRIRAEVPFAQALLEQFKNRRSKR